MELLKEKLEGKKFLTQRIHTTERQELGKELTVYFKKNCYWIMWRFEMWKIRSAFKEHQNLPKDKKTFNYFLEMLRH